MYIYLLFCVIFLSSTVDGEEIKEDLGNIAAVFNVSDADIERIMEQQNNGTSNSEKGNSSCVIDGKEGLCVIYNKCRSEIIDINGDPEPPMLDCQTFSTFVEKRGGCGWSNPEGIGYQYVEDQTITKYGEFPWVVAVMSLKNPDSVYSYSGSGSLMHPSVVITGAHILKVNRTHRVRAGEWDAQSLNEPFSNQERDVVSVEIHGNFKRKTLDYNVALLFLDKSMTSAPNVGVVCLPPKEMQLPEATCYTTRWGKNNFDNKKLYNILLRKIQISPYDHSSCERDLRKTRLSHRFRLHSSFMCGKNVQEDTCQKDGGAALVCPIEKDRYMQTGIMSWGIGCEDAVEVFTDVSQMREWIDSSVIRHGYNITSYSDY